MVNPENGVAVPRPVVYGLPPAELVDVPEGSLQVSPLIPGSARLEDHRPAAAPGPAVVLAPPGTAERRYTLAHALRALSPGETLVALAPKDRGGSRLGKELAGFGCTVSEEARRHHRICTVSRPDSLEGLDEAIDEGRSRHVDNLALCTQPGIFSWNRVDPGSVLLLRHLPKKLSGKGADFGCGLGILALAVLHDESVTSLAMIDIDRRAVEMARRNVVDPRATIRWADIRQSDPTLTRLDFVVMNPPFHDGGAEDQALGKVFIARAAEALRSGGTLWITANQHLPYEAPLRAAFRTVTPVAAEGGFKVYEARK
ncbi:class I SAM-dependent methyltransferase [Methylobacterium haplocladii]|uniref:Methyltransferase n=1 Tax=Methylobacterium haplocladii TaxID=1176176 RepID=A0A512IJJ7_9HYPH|nr:class I SAM-dependent methyltransferase [Methylobacterium haplocladii]GEO97897.1 methyltransferase [Methylobacterium haplocladii]GJD84868.1 Ribosomal RNA small subunit methyltransferase C [Methylobacterium haplocladii]GLS57470.1 methyltransferase [Methylobacterium haplocladii]